MLVGELDFLVLVQQELEVLRNGLEAQVRGGLRIKLQVLQMLGRGAADRINNKRCKPLVGGAVVDALQDADLSAIGELLQDVLDCGLEVFDLLLVLVRARVLE